MIWSHEGSINWIAERDYYSVRFFELSGRHRRYPRITSRARMNWRNVWMQGFGRFVAGAAYSVTCLVWASATAAAQSGAKNGEWRTYGVDLGSTRYSPLDEVNADNFNKLEVAWRLKTHSL